MSTASLLRGAENTAHSTKIKVTCEDRYVAIDFSSKSFPNKIQTRAQKSGDLTKESQMQVSRGSSVGTPAGDEFMPPLMGPNQAPNLSDQHTVFKTSLFK